MVLVGELPVAPGDTDKPPRQKHAQARALDGAAQILLTEAQHLERLGKRRGEGGQMGRALTHTHHIAAGDVVVDTPWQARCSGCKLGQG